MKQEMKQRRQKGARTNKHAAQKDKAAAQPATTRPPEHVCREMQVARMDSLVLQVLLAVTLVLLLVCLYIAFSPKEAKKTAPDVTGQSMTTEAEDFLETIAAMEDGLLGCDELMDQAKEIIDTTHKREWDRALDVLATCVFKEPLNSAARWNLAVILLQLDRVEEGLSFIDQALSIDPNNLEYLRSSASFLSELGLHAEVIRCLEKYLEVSLHVPSWEQLLASISVQREDEWMFLYDAGEDVVLILEMLQTSYLHEMSLIKAGYLYKILIGLKGDAVEMNQLLMYSTFSSGLGDFSTGMKYLRLYTERQYLKMLEGYGDIQQAYEVITAHSLRLFTAGFNAQIINLAKNLLTGGEPVWEELVYNCELSPEDHFNFTVFVSQSELKKVFIKCIQRQGVVQGLLDEGAVVYAVNIFGWTPLLHAAALGSLELIKLLLSHKADPLSRTNLAQTSLHVVATRGNAETSAAPFLEAGLKADTVDYFNRTALHVACLHGLWSAEGMSKALGQSSLPPGCPSERTYHPPSKLPTYGGWLPTSISVPKQLSVEVGCSFDVLQNSAPEEFVYDYLTLQRPVLIRNATNVHSMKRLHQRWQRSKFEHDFGSLMFSEAEGAPPSLSFAESFGRFKPKMLRTSAKSFLDKMRRFQEENKDVTTDKLPHPTYIFENVPHDSPLLRDFNLPSVLNENITHISTTKMQFHLGPPLSGSPPHFRRNSWNVLIYGQKRWFLYPPNKAFYSKQSVWDWWRGEYSRHPDALECVQYPGDLVFVPDMWGQAEVNLRESIGIASEFIYGASEFSI